MWHTIVTSEYLDSSSGDQVRSDMTFHTSQIADISITTREGVSTSSWLTLKGVNEDNQPVAFKFDRSSDISTANLELMVMLKAMLSEASAYYEDEQGNIFPYDQVTYANAKAKTIVMGKAEIQLDPQTEWPVFANGYRNYLDLVKA